MNHFSYIAMIVAVVLLAGVFDKLWLRFVRPHLASRLGWRPIGKDEEIPLVAFAGASVVLLVLALMMDMGAATGF